MNSEQILVVDDEPLVRTMVSTTLRKAGYSVQLASDGEKGLALVRQSNPQLVLADLAQGAGRGHFLDAAASQYPDLPLLLMTTEHDSVGAIEAMRRGAIDVLLKPFEAQTLLKSVRRGLEKGAEQRQHATYRQGLEMLVEARTSMLRQAVNDLERSYDITLEALGDALDLKDSETEGHSRRVTAYTIALAHKMKVSQAEVKVIARGAFLHDIGKMAIPDAILLKPGRLDSEEQNVMREHCRSGYLIVRKIPYLKEAAEIVYSHQEHFNGSGYPRQLRGEEIPLGARIFSVADTLDAITSDRPYRKGNTFAAARQDIERCSGTQFDPAVVEAFLDVPSEVWEDLRVDIVRRGRPNPG